MHVLDAEHLEITSTIPFNAVILFGVLTAFNGVQRTVPESVRFEIRDLPLAEYNPSRLGVPPPGCL